MHRIVKHIRDESFNRVHVLLKRELGVMKHIRGTSLAYIRAFKHKVLALEYSVADIKIVYASRIENYRYL